MQMPPTETIPTLPDDANPGKVPPLGPMPTTPDDVDTPLPGGEDVPGENPSFPPGTAPFPDTVEPPADHPRSL